MDLVSVSKKGMVSQKQYLKISLHYLLVPDIGEMHALGKSRMQRAKLPRFYPPCIILRLKLANAELMKISEKWQPIVTS